MQRLLLITSLLFSPFLVANDFNINSAFGVHKGMTKSELDKVITDFKKQPQEKNFYCTAYNSTYTPIKGDFDYYTYTFYKDNELIGITGIKQNTNNDNDFFNKLLTEIKNKYGDETRTNKDYPLEDYHYYAWDLEQDNIDIISIRNFLKNKQVKLSYFFIPVKTCLKK